MEFTNLFTGSDNLFKFLFLAGLFLLVLSLVYPLEKRNELEIEIINVNKETDILNNQISVLKDEVSNLSQKVEKINSTLDSLVSLRSNVNTSQLNSINSKVEKIKDDFNLEYNKLASDQAEIKTKTIILEYNKSRIDLLKQHQTEYAIYFEAFKWIGIVLIIVGIFGWYRSHSRNEKIKDKQINNS